VEGILVALCGFVNSKIENKMKAQKQLPSDYQLSTIIDLAHQPRLLLALNLAGLILFLLFFWLFWWLTSQMRPQIDLLQTALSAPFATILWIVTGFVAVLVLHEMVHGACFWWITHQRPQFGLRSSYAFAAAPDWYIPRNPYLLVGLSPLVVISLVGVLLLALLPPIGLVPLILALATNASGAVGDVAVIFWLLTRPSSALVQDFGDAVRIYLRVSG
jgi:hypothetical protein